MLKSKLVPMKECLFHMSQFSGLGHREIHQLVLRKRLTLKLPHTEKIHFLLLSNITYIFKIFFRIFGPLHQGFEFPNLSKYACRQWVFIKQWIYLSAFYICHPWSVLTKNISELTFIKGMCERGGNLNTWFKSLKITCSEKIPQ